MSIAVRRSLAHQLQQLRLTQGKTIAQVASTKIVSRDTLMSIERAERPIKIAHVISLCDYYDTDRATRDQFVQMAQNTEKGWWEDYGDVMDPKFRFFIQLESGADEICTYDSELLYGLLQTPAYHRAVFDAEHRSDRDSRDREVQFRLDRQRATFGRHPALQVTAVLNEAVLVRQVGGAKVMAELRAHLLDLSRQTHISLFVLPWDAGAHAVMGGPFQVVGFNAPDNPDVVYLETALGIRYVEEDDRVRAFRERFNVAVSKAIPLEEYLT